MTAHERAIAKERDEAQESNKKLSAELLALHRAIADDFILQVRLEKHDNRD